MFMILPTRDDSAAAAADDRDPREEPCEQVRTRVKKACNRCRIKKSKCNGRIPCGRCERDNVICRAEYGSGNVKELSRSYISSLEEQQLSLLGALRELHRRAPDDSAIRDTMKQLQARGFDVGAMEPQDHTLQANAPTCDRESPMETLKPISWDYNGFVIDNLESLLAQPATPQVVSDFLWNFGDASAQQGLQQDLQQNTQQDILQDIQLDVTQDMQLDVTQNMPLDVTQNMQQDALFSIACPDNESLMDPFLPNSADFIPGTGTTNYSA